MSVYAMKNKGYGNSNGTGYGNSLGTGSGYGDGNGYGYGTIDSTLGRLNKEQA